MHDMNELITSLPSKLKISDGFAIEVGASDGVRESKTFNLETLGWTVICVEANPYYAEKARKVRKIVVEKACSFPMAEEKTTFTICNEQSSDPDYHMQAGSGLVVMDQELEQIGWKPVSKRQITVETTTLDKLLEEFSFPRLDFLSIDVEGVELWVLYGFDIGRWLPKIIAIESWKEGNLDSILLPFGYKRYARDQTYTDWYELE